MKASGNIHPTVKPISLMRYLCKLVKTPLETCTILDPFMGSGTTGVACVGKALSFTGIEREPRHFDTACRRIADELSRPRMFAGPAPATSVQEALL